MLLTFSLHILFNPTGAVTKPRWIQPDLYIQRRVRQSPVPFNTPIAIISRDLLTYLQRFVAQLHGLGYFNIYIFDSNSSYPPLLSYYKRGLAWVYQSDRNFGSEMLWRTSSMNWNSTATIADHFDQFGRFVLSDPDLFFTEKIPRTWLQHFIFLAEKYNALKVGSALKIDDIPNCYPGRFAVWQQECNFWMQQHLLDEVEQTFSSVIDTTLALYNRPLSFFLANPDAVDANPPHIRVGGEYIIRHVPWYENWRYLPDDVSYAIKHRGRGIFFGGWHHHARRGKIKQDMKFMSTVNKTSITLPLGNSYVGFCTRFQQPSRHPDPIPVEQLPVVKCSECSHIETSSDALLLR